MIPVSVFIITKNEEGRLAAAIRALQPWADEILVVDSGSIDRTVEIARGLGARVMHRIWTGYGPQKRFAEQNCRNDWVLNIDADEVITPELADEICQLFAIGRPPRPGSYRVKILTVYPGDTRPRRHAKDYNVVRLYNRSVGSYRDHAIHDRVVITSGETMQLEAPVYHFSSISFEHIIRKGNNFSSFSSKYAAGRSLIFLKIRLLFEFPLTFVKYYIFRRHWTGGWKGFYFALCHAFMRTSRIAKMLELALAVPAAPPVAHLRGSEVRPIRSYFRPPSR